MNDRELLELAAKACGIGPVIGFAAEACELMIGPRNHMRYWRPLTDDGDALRLAVKLQMDLYIFDSGAGAVTAEIPEIEEDAGDDIQAAVRRVIVRVAAAAGEDMP